MAHLHRFYLPAAYEEGAQIPLPEAEAHHALRVARLRPGDELELFDGEGRAARAALEQSGKREAFASIMRVLPPQDRQPLFTLLVAWLHKAAAMEEIIRRGTEIGVTRFAFFRAARSEQPPKLGPKLERIAVEACKQCGRNWLPEIVAVQDAAAEIAAHGGRACVAALRDDAVAMSSLELRPSLLAVGPEGDFTAEELDGLLAAGAAPVTLGDYVYRTEAAAILGATLLLQAAGAFR